MSNAALAATRRQPIAAVIAFQHLPIGSGRELFQALYRGPDDGIAARSMPPLTAPREFELASGTNLMNGRRGGMRVYLKGVHSVRMRLADGKAKVYHYAWRGGPRLAGAPGSPEFVRSFHEAHAARKQPTHGCLFGLLAEFRTSAEYLGLAASTRRAYGAYLKAIEVEFGERLIPLTPGLRNMVTCGAPWHKNK